MIEREGPMRFEESEDDLRLARLLRAVRADADPALWTRVRARIESRARVAGLLGWAMRPAALAASLALLIAASLVAVQIASDGTLSGTEDYATLGEALIAERDAEASSPAPTTPARPPGGAVRDSGRRL